MSGLDECISDAWMDLWANAPTDAREAMSRRLDLARSYLPESKADTDSEISATLRTSLRLQAGADAALLQTLVNMRYDGEYSNEDARLRLQKRIGLVLDRLASVGRITPVFDLLNDFLGDDGA